MASPNLIDVMKISGDTMSKKVIKAAKAEKRVKELTKGGKKPRSEKEVRNKLYGEK